MKGKELDFITDSLAFEIKSGQSIDQAKYQKIATTLHKKLTLIGSEEAYVL